MLFVAVTSGATRVYPPTAAVALMNEALIYSFALLLAISFMFDHPYLARALHPFVGNGRVRRPRCQLEKSAGKPPPRR
jgi:hypothetical protein